MSRKYWGPPANPALYANKIHLRSLDEPRPICSSKTGVYKPIQFTMSLSQVTCERCKVSIKSRGIKP